MKILFDIAHDAFADPEVKGALFSLFLLKEGLEINQISFRGVDVFEASPDWRRITGTPRELLVAVMGDAVYDDRPRWDHFYHTDTGLHVLWYCDGDTNILFHKELKDGFTILNSRNGLPNRWETADLDDPRNDPGYNPFE